MKKLENGVFQGASKNQVEVAVFFDSPITQFIENTTIVCPS